MEKEDKWMYDIENGSVIIYKNGEYYDEVSINTLAENYIDKIVSEKEVKKS